MERFAKKLAKTIQDELSVLLNDPKLEVLPGEFQTPPQPELGDFAFPCFKYSKALKKAPPLIAQELSNALSAKIKSDEYELSVSGPYLNIKVLPKLAYEKVLYDILDSSGPADEFGSYGKKSPESRDTWVLEYSSPNVAKPFQIYHLRPTILGAALDRIGRFRGFRVISINHLGDWGTQYGKMAIAMKLFGDELPSEPTINDFVQIYVKFHKASEKDESLNDQAREAFLKLEQGDPEITQIWKRLVNLSLKEFNHIYEKLDVHFDHFWGESFYKDQLDPLIQEFQKKGILEESQGALVVPVVDEKGKELPPCILKKKDGATIYATRDVAAAIYRFQQFNFDRMTYIVGETQKLHFKQIFLVLKKAGYTWADRCEHIPTGTYKFKGNKMATRTGEFVTLDDALNLAYDKVKEIIEKRENAKNFSAEEMEDICEKVSIGAVSYFDLSSDPVKDVDFDIERVVDFEGETGPYLQYAHTRCMSILRKAKETKELTTEVPLFDKKLISELKTEEELLLVKTLGQLPQQLEKTLESAKASQFAHYLIDVTRAFNSFYRNCHVLNQKKELTQARLLLVEASRRILGRGLQLLGIPRPDKM